MKRMTKLCFFVASAIVTFVMLTFSANAETVKEGSCGANVSYTLDDAGVLTINGSGAMENFTPTGSPWYSSRADITKVVVEEGVTSLENYAFRNCINLYGITLPKSLSEIGKQAFYSCLSVEKIEIPDGVTVINDSTFKNCSSLTMIKLGNNVTSLGDTVFEGCEELSAIKIPRSVEYIGDDVFTDCAEDFTATVYYGNAAESYCRDWGYSYAVICSVEFYSDKELLIEEEYPLGAFLVMPENTREKEAYNFCGWEAGGTKYSSGDSITVDKNLEFNAVWEIKTYSIVFETGGAEAIEPVIKKHGEDIFLPENVVKEGYDFLGWSKNQNSAEAELEGGAVYSLNETASFYAVWKEKTYKVYFDANGGEGSFDMQIKRHFTPLQITDNVPVKTGSTFIGWGISSEAVQPRYYSGGLMEENDDMTLYAVWKDGITTGDADLSGEINISDLLMMMQRLNNYNVEYSEDNKFAMDVFGDTYFNIKDVLKMAQYLAGWSNIVLGEGN